ncbi:tRNA (adenosine(37)-N6)-threonylcarbamoyltransferase complex dimerization subunit type 1 TsaB [Arenibacter sp. M-2]|uniref:tRNA (adenosine(37)-N6)-threonylcarbamoyltransferase complex dimerization subunit type 1 TsaB n=1 Tax=Arenibacter sp. M-2 TaxID=3053612 RepID=UPI002570FDC7|nr:tRNA (adenosine(37)-N6)-threonylcarbamoyltransferase complex dimerization subunit type 1 TsaB [Arenibacter sp. M-2]MDL5513864.1 tRNA (adenosine(37)-N6)-threonylcarbamoyltransferase complex dimerization subunit type 1 TsaB [Arenibacter sp. M-2]|tara:strand:+ start:111 stop:782 length:672 start_codon:yes stop_codon:yes gene_type:complete
MAMILNLETATTNCSVGIAKNGEIISMREDNSPNYSHSEQLHIFIEEALKGASLTFKDISAIAVSKGPGSYTGLRIGVSAAKGLCFSLDLPLISVSTLESLAKQGYAKGYDFIIPLLDARRMEVYSAVFNAEGSNIRETRAEIINEDSFLEYAQNGSVLLIGDGAEKCRELLDHPNFSYHSAWPTVSGMGELSYKKFKANDFENVAYFEPYYLKDFMLPTKKS